MPPFFVKEFLAVNVDEMYRLFCKYLPQGKKHAGMFVRERFCADTKCESANLVNWLIPNGTEAHRAGTRVNG